MRWLIITQLLVSFAAFFVVLFQLPPEATQGWVQKIFFFHVPSAFAMYSLLVVSGFYSFLYTKNRDQNLDDWAHACQKAAFIFGCLVMVSGPIWAKPIWGVYWTWDPRLTTSFIIFILLGAIMVVRKMIQPESKAAMVSAVLGWFAILDIPLIHFSVQLWRGVHPSVLKNEGGLPDSYSMALQLMIAAWTLLAILITILFKKIITAEHWLKERDRG